MLRHLAIATICFNLCVLWVTASAQSAQLTVVTNLDAVLMIDAIDEYRVQEGKPLTLELLEGEHELVFTLPNAPSDLLLGPPEFTYSVYIDALEDKTERYDLAEEYLQYAYPHEDQVHNGLLVDAIRANDPYGIKLLLKEQVDINAHDKDGHLPLVEAAKLGLVHYVDGLIRRGANPEAKDGKGQTPLIAATNALQLDVVKRLLQVNTLHIDLADFYGNTALHYAAQQFKEDKAAAITAYLIEQGANPNIKNAEGRTPLHFAAQNELKDVARELLRRHSYQQPRDNDGNTPMMLTTSYSMKKLLREYGAKE